MSELTPLDAARPSDHASDAFRYLAGAHLMDELRQYSWGGRRAGKTYFDGLFKHLAKQQEVTEDAEFEIIEPKMITDGTTSDAGRAGGSEKGEGT